MLLLVEDSTDDELLTLRGIRRSGVEVSVSVARDGCEALELLEDGPAPDLVLLDLKLPKISGMDVLRAIRKSEETRCLPVVIFSSAAERADIHEAYSLAANCYIQKPVDFSEFVEAVGSAVRFWFGPVKLPPEPNLQC